MRLLIGVDGSPSSLTAVESACRLVQVGDEIAIYYSPVDIPLKSEATTSHEMLDRARQALGDAVFDESRKRLPEPLQAKVETILGTQRASRGLVAAVSDWRADVVCVGSRGLGPIKSLLLGSVATAIVQSVHVPILVVRAKRQPPANGVRVLLAYDPTNAAEQAAALQSFSWPAGSVGQVISVIDSMPAPLPSWMEHRARSADAEAMSQAWVQGHQEEKRRIAEQLAAFNQTLPEIFHASTPLVAEGHAAEQILHAATQSQTDLIVVGKTSRSLYQRVMLGSTSQAVLQQADCSVLVVPQRETP